MTQQEKINYVEFPAKNINATKRFFEQAFGWSFEDFGDDYSSFTEQGLDGGFYRSELSATRAAGSVLVVLLSEQLETSQENVIRAGGIISQAIFSFPGGRRFHFIEPSGNELAVWSKLPQE